MFLRSELPWLPSVQPDFRERVRSLSASDSGLAKQLRSLASQKLSVNQLSSLTRAVARLKAADARLKPLRPVRLTIVGNASTELINEALVGTALRHGVDLTVTQLPFGSLDAQVLDPSSELNASKPDVVWVLLTHHAFAAELGDYVSLKTAYAAAEEAVARHLRIQNIISERLGATVVLQTIPLSSERLFGSADSHIAGTMRAFLMAYNQQLVRSIASPHLVLDLDAIAQAVGLDDWHDPIQWYAYKLPFAQRFVPLVADHVARLIAAWRGLARKCLVLDLDNTVWGGVIGDDGIEGIRLGQGSAAGEAFLEIQRLAIDLRRRGIVLAVSSKNEDDVARLPFRDHPDMLLTEKHIAVFQANWLDKAENLRQIAAKLELGLDALVLLDDNPAERAQVRGELPEVAVPELPGDPAYYTRALTAAGYFDATAIVDEDLARADMYGQNAQRVELLESSSDMASFLDSLDMQISFAPFDKAGRTRIGQLINKSNQFNLTTRRYAESELAGLETDPDVITIQVRLLDRFGDNGMIGVIIARPIRNQTFEIDSWLMSCRVLRRRVEEAMLRELAELVSERGGRHLLGKFVPSGRNEMVREHYAKLGFKQGETAQDGSVAWSLALSDAKFERLPFKVRQQRNDPIAKSA